MLVFIAFYVYMSVCGQGYLTSSRLIFV